MEGSTLRNAAADKQLDKVAHPNCFKRVSFLVTKSEILTDSISARAG
jgi:hypothetical protein